ncbi:hypothetical protein E4U10_007789 [Claviceps purpurea]|nr:hypothetical protein E4U10_007789 [Claviceps purpurea]
MSFLSFKFDNTPEPDQPTPAVPDSYVTPTFCYDPSLEAARALKGFRTIAPALPPPPPPPQFVTTPPSVAVAVAPPPPPPPPPIAQAPPIPSSMNDGRARKRGAAYATDVFDAMLRPWSSNPVKILTCYECKVHKTRCEKMANAPGDSCSRCLRLGKPCVFENTPGAIPPQDPRLRRRRRRRRSTAEERTLPEEPRPAPVVENQRIGLEGGLLISRELAQKVFDYYLEVFLPKCPMVVLAPGTNYQSLQATKPILFLFILSVASHEFCSLNQQRELLSQARAALVEHAIVREEQSLELVQALQLAALWYRASDSQEQFSLMQLIHMMVTMAVGIGLDKVGHAQDAGRGGETWALAEAQRAWLGCYHLSMSTSLILRQPTMMDVFSDMEASIRRFQNAQAAPSDVFFCEMVQLEQLCQDVGRQLSLSDEREWASVCEDIAVEIARDFQERVKTWKSSCDEDVMQEALVEFGKLSVSMYAHEPAMHVDHNIHEFRAPFTYHSIQTCTFATAEMSTPQLLMLRELVAAAHGLLNCFLGFPVTDLMTLSPHIYGARVIYALILLCKLYKAVKLSKTNGSTIWLIGNLRLEQYLDRVTFVARDLLALDGGQPLGRSFRFVEQLRKWFYKDKYGALPSPTASPSLTPTTLGVGPSGAPWTYMDVRRGDQELQQQQQQRGYVLAGGSTPGGMHSPMLEYPPYPPPDVASRYDWFVDDEYDLDLFY